ncbi:AzlC family protein, partial [Neisseria meningitidis]
IPAFAGMTATGFLYSGLTKTSTALPRLSSKRTIL